jgi:hypothetical protein
MNGSNHKIKLTFLFINNFRKFMEQYHILSWELEKIRRCGWGCAHQEGALYKWGSAKLNGA